MRKYLYGLLFLLLIIISVLFYFKKDIETTTHQTNTIDYGIAINVPISDWLWLEIESIIKQEDNTTERLRILAHGIPTSVGGIRFDELGFQIINGVFITQRGIKSNSYFQERLKNNQNILITLDSCNTGSYYNEAINEKIKIELSYAHHLGLFLKKYIQLKNPQYKGKIIINAPNGYITWLFGINYVFSPNYAQEKNDKKGKINEFIF